MRQEQTMSETNVLTPFDKGKIAVSAGEQKTANPYPSGTEEHDKWIEGYDFIIVGDDLGESLDFA